MEKRKARDDRRNISYFGDEANDFDALERLFKDYSETGKGKMRRYLHTFDEAVPYNQMPGTFTPWENLGDGTDPISVILAVLRDGSSWTLLQQSAILNY